MPSLPPANTDLVWRFHLFQRALQVDGCGWWPTKTDFFCLVPHVWDPARLLPESGMVPLYCWVVKIAVVAILVPRFSLAEGDLDSFQFEVFWIKLKLSLSERVLFKHVGTDEEASISYILLHDKLLNVFFWSGCHGVPSHWESEWVPEVPHHPSTWHCLWPSLVFLVNIVNTPAEAYGLLYKNRWYGMMTHACNLRTWKLEVGLGPQVWVLTGPRSNWLPLENQIQTNQGYGVRPCLQNNKQTDRNKTWSEKK